MNIPSSFTLKFKIFNFFSLFRNLKRKLVWKPYILVTKHKLKKICRNKILLSTALFEILQLCILNEKDRRLCLI